MTGGRELRTTTPMRVLVIFGTRPEAIKLAPVIKELQKREGAQPFVCVTAQHRELLDQVLEVFEVSPTFDLNVMQHAQTLDQVVSRILVGLDNVFDSVRPDYTIVQGDTVSTFCGALASFHRRVPIGHVEAGLRTGDLFSPWPEELYRRFVDTASDLLWAPTNEAAQALVREGVPAHKVMITGNTVVDALHHASAVIDGDLRIKAQVEARLAFLSPHRRIILVTGHRRESFDGGLAEVCEALAHIGEHSDAQIVWPVHPNPVVNRTVRSALSERDNLHLIEPLDYLSFIELMRRSYLIVTDSGGVQEEAPSLGKPVLITREHTERLEAVRCGSAVVTGADKKRIVAEVELLLSDDAIYQRRARAPNPFGDGRAAARIVDSLLARTAPSRT